MSNAKTQIFILRATGRSAFFSGTATKLDGTAYWTQESAEAAIPAFLAWCCGVGNKLWAMELETIKVEVIPLDLEVTP